MNPLKAILRIAGCSLMLLAPVLQAAEITVAVAANFAPAMRGMAAAFEAASGHRVTLATGSSGRLYAQVVNGAPYDLFFSADEEKPAELVARGLAVAESRFTYALGALVLWSADPQMPVEDGEVLRDPSRSRVALANPRLAPYGAAAVQVLEHLKRDGIDVAFRVMGENITQAYQFVETGNVPAGFVALSQVLEDGQIRRGIGWVVPQDMYDPIRQDAVLLNRAADNEAAKSFLDFSMGEEAKSIIGSFGYGTD